MPGSSAGAAKAAVGAGPTPCCALCCSHARRQRSKKHRMHAGPWQAARCAPLQPLTLLTPLLRVASAVLASSLCAGGPRASSTAACTALSSWGLYPRVPAGTAPGAALPGVEWPMLVRELAPAADTSCSTCSSFSTRRSSMATICAGSSSGAGAWGALAESSVTVGCCRRAPALAELLIREQASPTSRSSYPQLCGPEALDGCCSPAHRPGDLCSPV